MPNPATVLDVADRWRPLTPAEESVATVLLDDAWWMLTARLPRLEDQIAAGTVSENNARRVLAAMVIRVMRNPDGFVDESVDDWRGRRHDLVASGVLTVTDAELVDLRPEGSRLRVRSVRLVKYGDA